MFCACCLQRRGKWEIHFIVPPKGREKNQGKISNETLACIYCSLFCLKISIQDKKFYGTHPVSLSQRAGFHETMQLFQESRKI